MGRMRCKRKEVKSLSQGTRFEKEVIVTTGVSAAFLTTATSTSITTTIAFLKATHPLVFQRRVSCQFGQQARKEGGGFGIALHAEKANVHAERHVLVRGHQQVSD